MLRGGAWKVSSQVGNTRLGDGSDFSFFADGAGEAVRLLSVAARTAGAVDGEPVAGSGL